MNESMVQKQALLEPARLLVNKEPMIINAILGTSVAVCIWDRVKRYGGMCHYVFPRTDDKKSSTVKYGNVAIYVLVKTMKEFGSEFADVEAQIFGGAEPPEEAKHEDFVSSMNIKAAHSALEKYGIRVTSEDTGGFKGRKLAFDTKSNEAIVLKVERLRNEDWYFEG